VESVKMYSSTPYTQNVLIVFVNSVLKNSYAQGQKRFVLIAKAHLQRNVILDMIMVLVILLQLPLVIQEISLLSWEIIFKVKETHIKGITLN